MVGKKRQTILTGNDVLDFNRFYNGKEEPPIFRKQFIDLKDKILVPLSVNSKKQIGHSEFKTCVRMNKSKTTF